MGLTEWHPDSCQCIMMYDDQQKYVDYLQKCQGHKHLTKQALLDEIISHNKQFRLKDQIPARRIELKRIKALGNPIKKPIEPDEDGNCPEGYNPAILDDVDVCILIGEEDDHGAILNKV